MCRVRFARVSCLRLRFVTKEKSGKSILYPVPSYLHSTVVGALFITNPARSNKSEGPRPEEVLAAVG